MQQASCGSGITLPDIGLAFRKGTLYPEAPFHPPKPYPEFTGSYLGEGPFDPDNHVYSMVREAVFRHLGKYQQQSGMIDLSALTALGNIRTVVIKPNWVFQGAAQQSCVTTHGAVLRPIIDYLFLAFGPSIEVLVADIPLQSADIEQIWRETGITQLREYYKTRSASVMFMDFRREKAVVDRSGFILRREPLAGDPRGYIEVCLDRSSYLEDISNNNALFSVNDYEPGTAACYHRPGQHRYLIPRSVLAADLFVNVPKLKTHCKAGITASMKNLIGINGEKGWIPHFRQGAPHDGGDEYSDRERHILRVRTMFRNYLQGRHRLAHRMAASVWTKVKRQWTRVNGSQLTAGGAWPGNDTLWRSILDLVRVITYADQNGVLRNAPQRRHLCVIDAIVCGEGEGPLRPSPKQVGAILCSSSPIAADWAACQLAGFDWRKIPQLLHARTLNGTAENSLLSPDSLIVSWANVDSGSSLARVPTFNLKPPSEWAGHIETGST
jgi:uncharacterized protein (DUF362 family)